MNVKFLLLIPAFLFACKSSNETTSRLADFQWLVGSWVMHTPGGQITEEWSISNDSLLTGSSAFVKNDSTIPFETIQLSVSNTKARFIVSSTDSTAGNKTVTFEITQYNDSGFTAENSVHDFPRRITYRLIHADSVHAFIDGGEQEPSRRSDFYYKRKNN